MFYIGPYAIVQRAVLAPLAGATDLPFRQICREKGAGLATSEMLTSDTRLWQSDKSSHRLACSQEAAPICMQIAGSEPEQMADAAQECVERGAQIVDINMGCPAKKVCKKLAGSALMKNEMLVAEIISSVIKKINVPVTLKMRTGWDKETRNGARIARIAEDNGVAAITVHGRTRACRFNGCAEYDTIAKIVSDSSIPVIANGDIASPQKAKQVLEYTGAHAIMIGRAALGNPWIFEQTNTFLDEGIEIPKPSIQEICKTAIHHMRWLHAFYGEHRGLGISRKHMSWYCQHISGAESFTKEFNLLKTTELQIKAIQQIFGRLNTYEEIAA